MVILCLLMEFMTENNKRKVFYYLRTLNWVFCFTFFAVVDDDDTSDATKASPLAPPLPAPAAAVLA